MPYAHHILVHFPIALGLLAAACAALAGVRPSPSHDEAARFIGYLAAVAAVFASVAGLLSAGHLLSEGVVDSALVSRHRNVALVATMVFVASAGLGAIGHRRSSARVTLTARIGTILAAAIVAAAGHFGGEMLHPGMAPWSDAAHGHGHGMMMNQGDDHHEGPPPVAAVMADHPAPSVVPSAPVPTTSAVQPAHRHTAPPAAPPTSDASAGPAPSARPIGSTQAPAVPSPSTSTPPMTGMPPGHRM